MAGRAHRGRVPAAPAGRFDARRFVELLKRRLAFAAAALFGLLWLLAAGHPVGATAPQDPSAGTVSPRSDATGVPQSTPRLYASSGQASRSRMVAPVLRSSSS